MSIFHDHRIPRAHPEPFYAHPMESLRTLTRIALGAIMTFAGVSHLTFARQEF